MKNSLYLDETTSTNSFLRELLRQKTLPEGFVVFTDFQTAGKGQIENSWESEKGKNLLFSILLYPHQISIAEQFIMSQIVSIALIKVLSEYCEQVKIKWPNDIYVNDKKLAGILIENSLQGAQIKSTIIGIGLNVNQTDFKSDAPNPVSLRLLNNKSYNRKVILEKIIDNILHIYSEMDKDIVREEYFSNLYRNDGFYAFRRGNKIFNARIKNVLPNGKLILSLENKSTKAFYFKEVEFII